MRGALEDELKQLEKEGNVFAFVLRSLRGFVEVRGTATEGRVGIVLLKFDSLLRWVTEETQVDLWETIENTILEPGAASPIASPEAPDTAPSPAPTITQTE